MIRHTGGVATSMSSKVTQRAVVWSGRVQGVGFRMAACSVASRFQIRGSVRNESDGSVRCELAGFSDELDRFIEAVEARMDQFVHDRHESAPGVLPMPEAGFKIIH